MLGLIVLAIAGLGVLANAQVMPEDQIGTGGTEDSQSTHPADLLRPESDKVGPVGVTIETGKFDVGFYEKILALSLLEPDEGARNVYDGVRYYDTIIVVSRDDGDSRSGDETARENKDAIVKRLQAVGARNIIAAESLSFVTASIPVADIPDISLHEEAYKIGDGEIPVTATVDKAIQTIHATPAEITVSGTPLDGTGVVVGVVDDGINSIYINNKVIDRPCLEHNCTISDGVLSWSTPDGSYTVGPSSSHGTKVAQVIAASGLPGNNGIAQGVSVLDVRHGGDSQNYVPGVAHAIDWAHQKGADILNLSIFFGSCSTVTSNTFSLILNEAVDKGMVAVIAAGNAGFTNAGNSSLDREMHLETMSYLYSVLTSANPSYDQDPSSILSYNTSSGNPYEVQSSYTSVVHPACAYNSITVGGIYDRGQNSIMYIASSRGPVTPDLPILVPHVVAPGTLQLLNTSRYSSMETIGGTSYAAPQVAAVSALLMQARPDITPSETKAAILLGANWTGPIPCTSLQYEQNNTSDMCSYAMQIANPFVANNAESLGILNKGIIYNSTLYVIL